MVYLQRCLGRFLSLWFLTLGFLILLGAGWVESASYFVSPSGSQNNNGLSTSSPALTISQVLSEVEEGDVIFLFPGRYEGEGNVNLLIDVESVTLTSLDPKSRAVISCGASCPTTPKCICRALQITGDHVVLDSLIIENGAHWPEGGGVKTDGKNTTITSCLFRKNQALAGGGVHASSIASLIMRDCLFERNTAENGGAVFLLSSGNIFSGINFSFNSAISNGGAISIITGDLFLSNSSFVNSSVVNTGGGIYVILSSLRVENTIFSNGTSLYGSGIHTMSTNATIISCSFYNNSAGNGASVMMEGGYYTFQYCNFVGNGKNNFAFEETERGLLSIDSCFFWKNNGGKGSDIYSINILFDVFVSNSIFLGCSLDYDHKLFNTEGLTGSYYFNNCTMANPKLPGQTAGILNIIAFEKLEITNCKFIGTNGAIDITSGGKNFRLINSTITSNIMNPAIRTKDVPNITISNVSFSNLADGAMSFSLGSLKTMNVNVDWETVTFQNISSSNFGAVLQLKSWPPPNTPITNQMVCSKCFNTSTKDFYGNQIASDVRWIKVEQPLPTTIKNKQLIPNITLTYLDSMNNGLMKSSFTLVGFASSNGELFNWFSVQGKSKTPSFKFDLTVIGELGSVVNVTFSVDTTTLTIPFRIQSCDPVTEYASSFSFKQKTYYTCEPRTVVERNSTVKTMYFVVITFFLSCLLLFSVLILAIFKDRYPWSEENKMYLFFMILGAIMLYITTYLMNVDPTNSICKTIPWMGLVGFIFFYGSIMICFVVMVFSPEIQMSTPSAGPFFGFLCILQILEIVFLIVWTSYDPYQLVWVVDQDKNEIFQHCGSSNPVPYWVTIIAYHGFLLAIGAFFCFKFECMPKPRNSYLVVSFGTAILNVIFAVLITVSISSFLSVMVGWYIQIAGILIGTTVGWCSICFLKLMKSGKQNPSSSFSSTKEGQTSQSQTKQTL